MTASALTQRLIADGLRRPAPPQLTDAQILLERIEEAMQPGVDWSTRRRVLAEAAAFVRAHQQQNRSAA